MAGLELFYWRRAEDGYEWVTSSAFPQPGMDDAEKAETRFLAPRSVGTARLWRYNPLVSHPTLYREFASLEPTEAGFLSFANVYGDLGVGVLLQRSGPIVFCDPLVSWRIAHQKIRPVVDVLNAIQDSDIPTLRQWFTVVNNGARFERREANGARSMSWVTIADQHREWIWRWATDAATEDETLIRIARGWAQDEINEAMSGRKGRDTLTSARVIFDLDRKQMTMHVTPESLLGALWFQCARVLTLDPTFRSCAHCGNWFEVSPDKRRRNAIYCSGRCKVAAYRARKTKEGGAIGSNIFAWMNPFYWRVRERPEWDALSEEERITALENEIDSGSHGRHSEQMKLMDRAGSWERAMMELEESYQSYKPILHGDDERSSQRN